MTTNSLALRNLVGLVCKYSLHRAYKQGLFTTYGGMLGTCGFFGFLIWLIPILLTL